MTVSQALAATLGAFGFQSINATSNTLGRSGGSIMEMTAWVYRR